MSAESLTRFSLNTATIKRSSLIEAISLTAHSGLGWIGLWRDRVAEVGVKEARERLDDAGLRVSSLCRGGFLSTRDPRARAEALADNRRAIAEAAELGASELVIVAGGLFDFAGAIAGRASANQYPVLTAGEKDLADARQRVAEAISILVPEALAHGVRLALEPLHPMYVADRAVLSTLSQALDLAEQFDPAAVGVVVDSFHVFWDPALRQQILRAGRTGRISSYQISDFVLPLAADSLLSRGYPGSGYIDFGTMTRWVTEAGYLGPVEVEIFNQHIWDSPAEEVIRRAKQGFLSQLQPALSSLS
ncbi:sugar phosphate isomerase/epimerase family protein [Psychromicrobium lacuslunae]|uniref:Xylose isomerase-like TIM barrel domain-containing protein n=1 Tax=Psychromicrobium lacuslunae TaxID=1618207 RepID=A0A0D4C1G7_9MICC|nr:sugar phosphate isomerase/epimerase family protein [Psychromicrobium lacuslunae]AJT42245.1 hypothetical protein UM93_13425 [Psychromicrobium lacuslunae]